MANSFYGGDFYGSDFFTGSPPGPPPLGPMAGSFFGGQFFGGEFFSSSPPAPTPETPTTGQVNLTTDTFAKVHRRILRPRFTTLEKVHQKFLDQISQEFRLNNPETEVISKVAQRQVSDLRQDEVQRTEELYREFLLYEMALEERHLKALSEFRERLIEQEIGERLRAKLDEEEAMLLIVLAAHLT